MVYSELIFITISISRFSIADRERLAINISLIFFLCRPINFAHASFVLYRALQYSKSFAILSCLAKQLKDVLPMFAASSLPRLFTNFCTKSGISCFSSIKIVYVIKSYLTIGYIFPLLSALSLQAEHSFLLNTEYQY